MSWLACTVNGEPYNGKGEYWTSKQYHHHLALYKGWLPTQNWEATSYPPHTHNGTMATKRIAQHPLTDIHTLQQKQLRPLGWHATAATTDHGMLNHWKASDPSTGSNMQYTSAFIRTTLVNLTQGLRKAVREAHTPSSPQDSFSQAGVTLKTNQHGYRFTAMYTNAACGCATCRHKPRRSKPIALCVQSKLAVHNIPNHTTYRECLHGLSNTSSAGFVNMH